MDSLQKTAQISQFIGTFFGAAPAGRDPLAWIEELINPESLTKNAVFLAALFQNFVFRYHPSAFFHVEEMDQSRGYKAIDPYTGTAIIDPMTGKPMVAKGTDAPYTFQHSQGHLENLDYIDLQRKLNTIPSGPHGVTTDHQFSEVKPEADMPMFVKRNINISEQSPEYKAMFKKLYPGVLAPPPTTANIKKFVKTAQTAQSNPQEQKAENVKKLMPRWDVKTMIDDLDLIAQNGKNKGMTNDQISQQIQLKLKQYQESIKPLHEFLVKNGYGQKIQ